MPIWDFISRTKEAYCVQKDVLVVCVCVSTHKELPRN